MRRFWRPEILEFEIVSIFFKFFFYTMKRNVKCVTNHLLCAHIFLLLVIYFLFCFVRSLISVYSNWNPFVPISFAQTIVAATKIKNINPQHIEYQLKLISIIFYFHFELAWFQFHALLFFFSLSIERNIQFILFQKAIVEIWLADDCLFSLGLSRCWHTFDTVDLPLWMYPRAC